MKPFRSKINGFGSPQAPKSDPGDDKMNPKVVKKQRSAKKQRKMHQVQAGKEILQVSHKTTKGAT